MFDLKEKPNVLHKQLPSSSTTTKEVSPSPSPGQETSPPPSYAADPPNITAGFSQLDLNERETRKPTQDQCIAHLKLLECFHELRETIATTDGLYGIKDDFVPSSLDERSHAALLTKVREKRWSIFVAQAAKRFETWWQYCIEPKVSMVCASDPDSGKPGDWKERVTPEFAKTNLPPIDVLMVWHTFMLNPRDYLSDCIRWNRKGLWNNGFPWDVVDACIDNETFEYETSEDAREYFESRTNDPYDALKMPLVVKIKCPKCDSLLTCWWTTSDQSSSWVGEAPGESGSGFAEKGFIMNCTVCDISVTHEMLRVFKFHKDVLCLRSGVPMPGTILDNNGKFGEIKGKRQRQSEGFPNRLLTLGGLDTSILAICDPKRPGFGDLKEVRAMIENALKDRLSIRKANGSLSSQILRPERIAVRRMMSCYWDNSSIFSLDLIGAVIRQGTFIEKMHAIDWLHSPVIGATMDRLLMKYSRFFDIMGKYSSKVAVPTLDVDLAWHTHQLCPKSYYAYATSMTGTFIDHDDKIDENRLSDAFEWTSKTYQKMFNEVYSECTCWYCEAIRESHTSILGRVLHSSKMVDSDLDRLHSTDGTDNPYNNPHISAHNAIKTEGQDSKGITREAKAYQLELSYKKACQRAKQKGRQPPARDAYMTTAYAYGYPVYVPYYAPYVGPGVSNGMYPSNPGCANVAAGAAGNCCKGTCGGMVAAGGCGGSGAGGGCAGGGGGGCGGGGGGCGGGGGGGGGGGCGGGGGGGGGC